MLIVEFRTVRHVLSAQSNRFKYMSFLVYVFAATLNICVGLKMHNEFRHNYVMYEVYF